MGRRLKVTALVFVDVLAGAEVTCPERSNPPTDPSRAIRVRAGTSSGLGAVLDRARSARLSNATRMALVRPRGQRHRRSTWVTLS